MPRRILLHQESRRLELGDDDWVALKPRWTVSDRQAISDAMMTIRWDTSQQLAQPRKGFRPGHEPKPKTVQPKMELHQSMNMYAANVASMKRGIVAWGGPGFCVRDHGAEGTGVHQEGLNGCQAMDLTEDAIMALDDTTSDLIITALNEFNPVVGSTDNDPDDDEEGESEVSPLSVVGGSI